MKKLGRLLIAGVARVGSQSTRIQQHRPLSIFSTTPFVTHATGENLLLAKADPPKFNAVRYLRQAGSGVLQNTARPAAQMNDTDMATPTLMISRIMHQDDVQMFGAVHGGVVLQMMEEAGVTLSEQYCNRFVTQKENEVTTLLGSLEKSEFLRPIFSGELAEVYAEVGYTSPHSVQIITTVYGKKISEDDAEWRLVNRAQFWFVATSKHSGTHKVMPVPPMTYSDPQTGRPGRVTYDKLKSIRDAIRPRPNNDIWRPLQDQPIVSERDTVEYSRSMMALSIHPSSCHAGSDYCRGGVLMKVMDECACLTCITHSSYFCFTISFDTVTIFRKVKLGSVLIATSKLIFTSSRSLEVLVQADELRVEQGKGLVRERAAEGILTFISIEGFGKLREFSQLKPKTEEEMKVFDERKKLYEDRKKEKLSSAA